MKINNTIKTKVSHSKRSFKSLHTFHFFSVNQVLSQNGIWLWRAYGAVSTADWRNGISPGFLKSTVHDYSARYIPLLPDSWDRRSSKAWDVDVHLLLNTSTLTSLVTTVSHLYQAKYSQQEIDFIVSDGKKFGYNKEQFFVKGFRSFYSSNRRRCSTKKN